MSLPGSGPKKMVLIFVPVTVLLWNWALIQGHQTPFGALLLDTQSPVSALLSGRSSLQVQFTALAGFCTTRVYF